MMQADGEKYSLRYGKSQKEIALSFAKILWLFSIAIPPILFCC